MITLVDIITFWGNEVQSLVNVGDLVKTHFAAVRFGQCFAGDDLQQQHEFQAIAEVFVDVFNAGASFSQVTVAPGCESLEGENLWLKNDNRLILS